MARERHTDRTFEEELRKLRDSLLKMGGMVETMIARSIEALMDSDLEKAREIIEFDHSVNRMEIDIDDLCMRMLALRQPAASDLRFITMSLKFVTDLERIGDLAVNICERCLDLSSNSQLKPYIDIPKMAEVVQEMIRDSLDAFIESDPEKAVDVVKRDDVVDNYHDQIFREIITYMLQDPSTIQRGIHLFSVAKYLERMGDHTENLAELVIFMIKGKDIRHMGKLEKEPLDLT